MEFQILLITLVFVPFVLAQNCFVKNSVHRILVNGKSIPYCEHNDIKYLAGQVFKTSDCYECFCEASFGLLCCGFGKNVPRYDFVGSEHCDIIEKNCRLYAVQKDDHSLHCHTGEPLLYDIDIDRQSSLQTLIDAVSPNNSDK